MITLGVLKRIGKSIRDADTGDDIGGNMDEAIFYFKDEDNSGIVTTLKARTQEASLKEPVTESRKTIA